MGWYIPYRKYEKLTEDELSKWEYFFHGTSKWIWIVLFFISSFAFWLHHGIVNSHLNSVKDVFLLIVFSALLVPGILFLGFILCILVLIIQWMVLNICGILLKFFSYFWD